MMEKSDSEAVNPQATLTTEDLSWLGGVIDSDGCITLYRRKRRNNRVNYCPAIVVSNSDPFMIEESSRILKAVNIGHWITWRKPYKRISKKMMGHLESKGYKRCRRALPILIPYLRGKRDQAELLLEYIEYRMALPRKCQKNSYGEIDDDYCNRLKQLKQKGASETIRGSHKVTGKI